MTIRIVAGAMTGTSLDGLDVALVAVEGEGLGLRARFVRGLSRPLGPLAAGLRQLAEQRPLTAQVITQLMRDFALLHAEAIAACARGDRLALACVHGQTVFHAPPLSWQLFQPAPLAQALGVPVVCDLRAADLARGGQGAPITPLADWIALRDVREARAVVNLGGFCNLTMLPAGGGPETVLGRDVCACNQVLDAIARTLLGHAYDADGAAALGAKPDPVAVDALAERLRAQTAAGRSLGTGDELAAAATALGAHLPAAVVARSACAAIARVIARATAGADRLILAGGGLRNAALRAELAAAAAPAAVDACDQHGIPAEYREAAHMAILGALCQDRVAITLPQVTGVRAPAPVAGVWALP